MTHNSTNQPSLRQAGVGNNSWVMRVAAAFLFLDTSPDVCLICQDAYIENNLKNPGVISKQL